MQIRVYLSASSLHIYVYDADQHLKRHGHICGAGSREEDRNGDYPGISKLEV